MIQNNKFEFVVHRENFLSDSECDKIIKKLDTDELIEGTLAGNYDKEIVNKNVRQTLNVNFDDKNLFDKINTAIKIANTQYFNYHIESIDMLRFLKYGIGGTYNWHTDIGRNECSMRKLTAIIQLSDEKDFQGGDFEFGITNESGDDLVKGNKNKGCLLIFPSFLSHRVAPITNGFRYSIITWAEGNTFK